MNSLHRLKALLNCVHADLEGSEALDDAAALPPKRGGFWWAHNARTRKRHLVAGDAASSICARFIVDPPDFH